MPMDRRNALKMATSLTMLPSIGTSIGAEREPGALDVVQTQIGPLNFNLGVPTPETVNRLFDAMDFHRAALCYEWAVPTVGVESARQMLVDNAGAHSGDLVLVAGYRDVSMMLGSNVTTPYVFAYFDLSRQPLVIQYPAGATAGSLVDWWDRPITDLGMTGPDAGNGAVFVLLGPDQATPGDLPAGARILRSRTHKVLMFCRGLDSDLKKVELTFSATRVRPYGGRLDRAPAPLLRFKSHGKLTSMAHPEGIAYWQRLADALRDEPIEDRDRFFAAMLKPLGIEANGAFAPDAKQRRTLERAAVVGQATMRAATFNKRIAGMRYREDSRWEYLIPPSFVNEQDVPGGTLFDERTAFFFEVTGTSAAVLSKTPGVGAAYLATYQDHGGAAYDGGRSYRLRVPANVPAKMFWSITLYDSDTRCLIQNRQEVVDRSSRHDLQKNLDGSIEIIMGPTAPRGLAKNWIPTTPGKAWYAYFRLFGPLEPYFERSWRLPDIEKAT
jgi:hypothetical protein